MTYYLHRHKVHLCYGFERSVLLMSSLDKICYCIKRQNCIINYFKNKKSKSSFSLTFLQGHNAFQYNFHIILHLINAT